MAVKGATVKDLIEALQIFAKYIPDVATPTSCDHDVLYVDCDPDLVDPNDEERLRELSFLVNEEWGCFMSFRFGSY